MSEEDASAQAQTQERVRKSITVGPDVAPDQGEAAQSVPSTAPDAPEPIVATEDPEPKLERGPVIQPELATAVEPEPAVVFRAQPVPSPRAATETVPDQTVFTPARPDRFVPLLQRSSSGGWTLQLVAGNLEQTALNILRRYPQVDAMVYTRGERNGKQWFMVFQGTYPSKDAARQAAQTLPAGLVSGQPWVRENRSLSP